MLRGVWSKRRGTFPLARSPAHDRGQVRRSLFLAGWPEPDLPKRARARKSVLSDLPSKPRNGRHLSRFSRGGKNHLFFFPTELGRTALRLDASGSRRPPETAGRIGVYRQR